MSVEDRIVELLRDGRKIEAIKLFREDTGVGLAEAKYAVEVIEDRYDIRRPTPEDSSSSGWGLAAILALLLAAAVVGGLVLA